MNDQHDANDDRSDGRSHRTRLLWFEVSGSALALPVEQVIEIRAPGRYVAVPGAPREVLGLIQHRGRMIPVIDLAERVGGTSWDAESGRSAGAVLIVETSERGGRRACALAVDRVSGVREHATDDAGGEMAGAILDLAAVFGARAANPGAAAAAAAGMTRGERDG